MKTSNTLPIIGGLRFPDLGKIATKILANGDGWKVEDVVCTAGPQDRPYDEQHQTISISVVLEGCFQYRSVYGSEVLSPGSLLLGNLWQQFQCSHAHGTGDRCLAIHYAPEFFERSKLPARFRVHRLPSIKTLTPWVVQAKLGIQTPANVIFENLTYGLAAAAAQLLGKSSESDRTPTSADERRISGALRFIQANLGEPLSLTQLASNAKMSEFHFLRVFRQVTGVTPHQYILRSRLREAALRLKTRSDNVFEIALDAGFRDLSNFNHAFRAEFGVTPAYFRSA